MEKKTFPFNKLYIQKMDRNRLFNYYKILIDKLKIIMNLIYKKMMLNHLLTFYT